MGADVTIRPAGPRDVPAILSFIRELAEYEQLAHQVVATEEAIHESLFGTPRQVEVLIAEAGGETAGFALFLHNYSTFRARHGLYLEDLYVRPAFRRRGIGRALLTRLAAVAVERGCCRFDWMVLDWNESARRFYESLGATPLSDWTTYRLADEPLAALAAKADAGSRADRDQR
jgi:GNAT superfamily N-acetyltransferase